jgi:uncharacterized protein
VNRRSFLKAAGAVTAGTAIGGAWSVLVEPGWLELSRTVVPVRRLPGEFVGFTIGLVSDTHLGPFVGRSRIRSAVDALNDASPDAVVLAGDYVLHSPEFIRPCMEELSRIRGRIFAVLGNHDHWEDADLTSRLLEEIVGAELLRNRGAWLERGDSTLRIWGVGDLWEDDQVIEGVRPEGYEGPLILISHNPDYAEVLPRGTADLILSGHTHGGQVVLPFIGAPMLPSYYGQKYRSGLVWNSGTAVYVSRGIGVGSPPMRLNCRPELPLIELAAAP